MSKAFTKEDDEIPEREGRARSSSGLPPGAVNYMTEEGAKRFRGELARAKGQRATELRRLLDSATIVPAHETPPEEVLFGARVTVRNREGGLSTYRIVGVDETRLDPGWVSWVSPLARALIGMKAGNRVRLPEAPPGEEVEIVKIA